MGRVWSAMVRPMKNINIESRAHKLIDNKTNIPRAAPRYPSTVEALDKLLHETPEVFDKQKQKDEGLLKNLRNVRIDSFGPPPEIMSKRPLPLTRTTQEEPEFGFAEPERIPVGKTTIRLALNFLAEYQAAPTVYTPAVIAAEHKLDVGQTEQILKYFHAFHMHMPMELKKKYPKLLDLLEAKKPVGPGAYKQIWSSPTDSEVKKS